MKKLFSRRSITIMALTIIVLFVAMEITLRKVWGFGETVLFKADENLEYIAQPNQERHRFGHKIVYNQFSMRSAPLRDDDKCVVLGFGDSVINGGALTDQDSLATTIVENEFGGRMRFLNISAGSWGPDNCAGYLREYGDFNAKLIVLFVSSHDAHDNMTFEPTVGYHESYPDKQYLLASGEVLVRYVMPRIFGRFQDQPSSGADNLMINKNGEGFNKGFEYFNNYTKEKGIPFIVCLHAEPAEIAQGKFNEQGEEIIAFCKSNNIKLISGLEIGEEPGDFRDGIHINERGQKRWAKVLFSELQDTVKSCL